MLLAIIAAILSAAFFGASSALQQRAASSDSKEGLSGLRLVVKLAQEPRWRLGIGLSMVGFALHAFALNGAMLALVQPIVVSGLVFAVFVRAAIECHVPPVSTIAWCTLTCVALVVFIFAVGTSPTEPPELGSAAWSLLVGGGVAVATVLIARFTCTGERRGLLYATAAGVFFGLVAGLAKLLLHQPSSPWWLFVARWPFWALLVVGAAAIVLNQRAFQVTRLSVTMPMVNIVNVIVAIGFGAAVFGERVFSTPLELVVQIAALLAMGLGVGKLAGRKHRSVSRPGHPAEDTASSPI